MGRYKVKDFKALARKQLLPLLVVPCKVHPLFFSAEKGEIRNGKRERAPDISKDGTRPASFIISIIALTSKAGCVENGNFG